MFISLDKTSVLINNKQTTVSGSDEVSLSKNFKENNPPDGKKISLRPVIHLILNIIPSL